jgi:hypothetical protein
MNFEDVTNYFKGSDILGNLNNKDDTINSINANAYFQRDITVDGLIINTGLTNQLLAFSNMDAEINNKLDANESNIDNIVTTIGTGLFSGETTITGAVETIQSELQLAQSDILRNTDDINDMSPIVDDLLEYIQDIFLKTNLFTVNNDVLEIVNQVDELLIINDLRVRGDIFLGSGSPLFSRDDVNNCIHLQVPHLYSLILESPVYTSNDLSTSLSEHNVLHTNNILDLQSITTTNTNDISTLQSITTTNASDISTLESITTTNTNDISTLQSITTTNTNDISNLQSITTTNTNDISTLQSITTTNTNDISTLQSITTTNASDISSLQSITTTNTSDIFNLQTDVNAIEENIITNFSHVIDQKLILNDDVYVVNENQSLSQRLINLNDQISAANSNIANSESDIHSNNLLIISLQERVNVLETNLNLLLSKLYYDAANDKIFIVCDLNLRGFNIDYQIFNKLKIDLGNPDTLEYDGKIRAKNDIISDKDIEVGVKLKVPETNDLGARVQDLWNLR